MVERVTVAHVIRVRFPYFAPNGRVVLAAKTPDCKSGTLRVKTAGSTPAPSTIL